MFLWVTKGVIARATQFTIGHFLTPKLPFSRENSVIRLLLVLYHMVWGMYSSMRAIGKPKLRNIRNITCAHGQL